MIIITCIFFIIIDNVIPFSAHSISFNKDTFLLIALTLLPSISENILCSYLGLNLGYKPGIVYLLIMNLYKYLLPIIPNPNEYLYSLIFLIFPLIVLIKIKNWFKKDRIEEVTFENYRQNKKELLFLIPLIIFSCALIYVVSGYFRYYAIAVASGSMEPKISKGDVVIVDKNYNEIKVGDVLAYKHDGKVIVHRIYRIVKNNDEYFIYTKGDAKIGLILVIISTLVIYMINSILINANDWVCNNIKKVKSVDNDGKDKIISYLNNIVNLNKIIFLGELISIITMVAIFIDFKL